MAKTLEQIVEEQMSIYVQNKMKQQEASDRAKTSGNSNDIFKKFQSAMESAYGSIKSERQYYNAPEMQKEQQDSNNRIFNTEQPFESISTEPDTANVFNISYSYRKYNEPADFGEDFKVGETFEESANNFREISKNILKDIERIYGGLDRITDLAVVSDILIINGVSYEPVLPESYIGHLPLDVQAAARNGQLAWIFNFIYLRKMPNLTNLMFDNTDFVFKKVRIDLTERRDFEPKFLFKYFDKLTNLQIGRYIFTRKTQDMYDDIFHHARRSTEIADMLESWGMIATKLTWNTVRDCYNNSKKRSMWKRLALGTLAGTGAIISGAGTASLKSARFTNKVGRAFYYGVHDVFKAVRENYN